MYFYNSLKIFIASPSDVQKERKAAEEVINAVDIRCRDTLGIRAECLKWENRPPLTPGPREGQIQDVIIREQVQQANVFVLILNKRYGSTSPGYDISNTEREVQCALEMLNKNRNISLLTYFRETPPNTDPGSQEAKLNELKKKLDERGLFYHYYKNADDFRQQFTHDLYYIFIKFRMSTSKVRALRSFWRLGTLEGQGRPQLAIIYPPVDRSFMQAKDPDTFWLERLIPNVVFEDFKAIQKLDKTLRLVGLHDIKNYSTISYPEDINEMNRVWLCVPRNIPAQHQLTQYEKVARFRFLHRHIHSESAIDWRPEGEKRFFRVQSPLRAYLEEQRCSHPGGEWTFEHGQIIAKDYAVLARFTDPRETIPSVEGTLKDFFLAGIRGLGTWGAGWFIDRRYNTFLKYENSDPENGSIQLLLEVTYKNEFIADVRDVSDMPQRYFEAENDIQTIRRNIQEHRAR